MKDPNFNNSVTNDFEKYKDKLFEPYIKKKTHSLIKKEMKKCLSIGVSC